MISVFDLFKIGIGPSSSHTMGPMTAARQFLDEIAGSDRSRRAGTKVDGVKVSLHGSLAHTGFGHGSDRAVILGLAGHTPKSIDPDAIAGIVTSIGMTKRISPPSHPSYFFEPAIDLVLDRKARLSGHANGMIFHAYDEEGRPLLKRIYYSIGGGLVVSEEGLRRLKSGGSVTIEDKEVPYAFGNAAEMLSMAAEGGLSIAGMMRVNEETCMSREELDAGLDGIWEAMRACIERGLAQRGVLPGGLNVRRRARQLHARLQEDWRANQPNPLLANDWLSIYAMAVNEDNAAGGRVVTAPTNGAAGVVPAVPQVPCIERNALGAEKAVTAASLAIKGNGQHVVLLDAAIETMRQTGLDMNENYKETSLGGLAVNVVGC
jgi:L-serine dehydratase